MLDLGLTNHGPT